MPPTGYLHSQADASGIPGLVSFGGARTDKPGHLACDRAWAFPRDSTGEDQPALLKANPMQGTWGVMLQYDSKIIF